MNNYGKTAAAAALALGAVALMPTAASAFTRQGLHQNGSGHCANGPAGPSSQPRIIIRPNAQSVTVSGPWVLQNVEQTNNGTILHLIGSNTLRSGDETVVHDGATDVVGIVIDNRAECHDVEPPTTTTTTTPVTPTTTTVPEDPTTTTTTAPVVVPPTVPPVVKAPPSIGTAVSIVRTVPPVVSPPVPSNGLAYTGTHETTEAMIAAALLASGAVCVVVGKRRRSAVEGD